MSQEVLLKLNPNGVNFDHIAGGGPSLIDREAVLWALGGVEDALYDLACLCELGENEKRSSVKNRLFDACTRLDAYKQFRTNHLGRLEDLCFLVIDEFVNQPLCKPCNGTGLNAEYLSCGCCGGTGQKPKSKRFRSKLLGISHSCWYQFEPLYFALMSVLHDWMDRVKRKLKKRLK